MEFLKTEYFKPSRYFNIFARFLKKESDAFKDVTNYDLRFFIFWWILIYEVGVRIFNIGLNSSYKYLWFSGLDVYTEVYAFFQVLIPHFSTVIILVFLLKIIYWAKRNDHFIKDRDNIQDKLFRLLFRFCFFCGAYFVFMQIVFEAYNIIKSDGSIGQFWQSILGYNPADHLIIYFSNIISRLVFYLILFIHPFLILFFYLLLKNWILTVGADILKNLILLPIGLLVA